LLVADAGGFLCSEMRGMRGVLGFSLCFCRHRCITVTLCRVQSTDMDKVEYAQRVVDEEALVVLGRRMLAYYKALDATSGTFADACGRLAMLLLEHLHYRHESTASAIAGYGPTVVASHP
jgi:hypothetical protein